MNVIKITQLEKDRLEQELDELKNVKRHDVLEKLKNARSLGDLSENAEYEAVRNEQGALESKIEEIELKLKLAVVVEHNKKDIIEIGSIVTVEKNKEKFVYGIGTPEVENKGINISPDSPVGLALVGHKKGEEIIVEVPKGKIKLKIVGLK